MFADFIEMTSSSGGAAAMTLAVVSGQADWTDLFGTSGTRLVSYSIQQFNDATMSVLAQAEAGIGTLDLSTLVLTRTTQLSTWDGTSYVKQSPSALTFSTDSTLIRISCEPLAEMPPIVAPYVNYTVGDAMGMTSYHSGAQSIHTMTSGQEYYGAFLWLGRPDIQGAYVYVTTAVASTALKACLYEMNGSGLPGQKLVDITASAAFDTTVAGARPATTSFYLPPGWYVLGLIPNGAPVLRGLNQNARSTFLGTSGGLVSMRGIAAGSYATGLPDPARSSITIAAGVMAALYLKPRN